MSPFTGTYRIAYLGKDASKAKVFDNYSDAIPTSGNIDYSFEGNSAELTFSYSTKSLSGAQTSSPLIFAMPHHLDKLQNPRVEKLVFSTVKGKVTGVVGHQWRMKERLSKIEWQAPHQIQDQN